MVDALDRMSLPEGLAADMATVIGLLTRIAEAVENLDGTWEEGGGVVAILHAENVRDVLAEVKGTSRIQT